VSAHGAASGTVELDAVAPLSAVRPHPLLATPRRVLKMHSDAALAERFRAGDQEAFAVLYERHRACVLAVCIGVLGSRHDAEDAAQDAFAALAVALRTSPPREVRAWLARVARNAAIDVIRRRRAVPSGDEDLESQAPTNTEVRAELESVLAGLRELPESQRTALLMRELGGHSYQEIGDLLALDETAVRGLIARGRIGLRAHREATEMPCAAAREALASELDGRHRDRTVRRHLRGCASCKAYGRGLRRDAHSLRAFGPAPVGGFAGGGAIFGGFAIKTALTGGVLSQVTAACAVSVCAVGGFALLYPHAAAYHPPARATAARAVTRAHRVDAGSTDPAAAAVTSPRPARHSAVSAAPAALTPRSSRAAASSKLAPARAAKVISAASIVLTRPFDLPGSQTTSTPTAAPPAVTPAPTTPAAAPTRPVAPARWGASPSGSPSGGLGDPARTPGNGGGSWHPYGGGTPSPTPTPAGGASGTGSGTADGSGSGTTSSPGSGGRQAVGRGRVRAISTISTP
jgi:RNA polymerase sigma factor (sigma-70 family)